MTPATQSASATENSSGVHGLPELTVEPSCLGGLITLAFTAANVYLGLKIGLTFATSIPAAVISMAVLRLFKSSSIFENNIVQTVASAAGTLASIIFVLPGLVIVGWWQGFPYWMTMAATGLGGILGVMFSVPLRRALVVNSDLPYPEGRAAAEVLLVGDQSRDGMRRAARDHRHHGQLHRVRGVFLPLSQTGWWSTRRPSTSASARAPRAYPPASPWRWSASDTWWVFRWVWRCSSASSSAGASWCPF
jgi:OPT family oligopeptide transporter